MRRKQAKRVRTPLKIRNLGQQQLRARVETQGLNQADIAAAINRTQQTVCRYMRGELVPESFEIVEWFHARLGILPEAWRLPPVVEKRTTRRSARAA